jgi:hypothetical protein
MLLQRHIVFFLSEHVNTDKNNIERFPEVLLGWRGTSLMEVGDFIPFHLGSISQSNNYNNTFDLLDKTGP